MAGKSNIEWTERTWNPIVGCTVLTPGCKRCYAMKMARRLELMGNAPHYAGTTEVVNGNAVWTGKVALAPDRILLAPLRRKKPTTYFVNSMGDLFHEDAPDEWIVRVMAIMAASSRHTFQVLTKRADRMQEFMTKLGCSIDPLEKAARGFGYTLKFEGRGMVSWPLPNIWLGVSTERQQEADERIPLLLQTPAAIRFVSAEPLLGPIDLTDRLTRWHEIECDLSANRARNLIPNSRLDWMIVGGESGANARPMHPDWARSLRDQCAAAGVAYFFKQWGEHLPLPGYGSDGQYYIEQDIDVPQGMRCGEGQVWRRIGKKAAGRLLDGIEHNAMPALVTR